MRIVPGLLIAASLFTATGAALAQRRPPREEKRGERPAADEKATQQELSLAVGETKTLPASDVKQYSEGTPGIIDVRTTPGGDRFIIVGQKTGSTSLLFIKNDGSQVNMVINVFSRPPELVERELTQLLEGYTGLRVRRVGSRLFIEGGVSTPGDQERIKQIAALYNGQVESLVTVGTGAIDRKLNIRIDFFFVQYNRNSGYQFGINWPRQIGGTFNGQPVIQSTFGYDFISKTTTAQASIVNQPLPGLDIAAQYGWAKVIKQATVITTNGSEASFGNGGELNIPVAGALAAQLQKIEFGTNVSVLPRFDPATRNLEVKVTADVSDLTPPLSSTIPGRQTSRLNTLVFLKLGQSLVLSGIRSRSQRHSIQGLPLLSEIPVLGVFFGSHNDDEEELEGAIFIIPSVVESVPKASYDIVKEAMAQYDDFHGDMDDVNTFQKKPPAQDTEAPPPKGK